MAKRRPSGDGMVRKRDDGRWEGRIVVGHKENGDSIFRYIYAPTQKELTAKLHQNIDAYQGVELTERSRMILSEWLDTFMDVIQKDKIWYDFFYTELTTGLRRGEICGLLWSDFDERSGTLKIIRTLHWEKGGRLVAGGPKTYAGTRKIVLPPSTAELLRDRKRRSFSPWIFHDPFRPESPVKPSSAYRQLKKFLMEAGLPDIRFHDLRHTFSTTALEHGMDIKTLSTIIGHVSSATTLNVYAHVTDEMRRTAAMKIDKGIGKAVPKTEEQSAPRKPAPSTFQAKKGQRRKAGTGCVSRINETLWEGRYSPIWPDGKKHPRNVYAHSEEECEKLLAEMILEMKAEIAAERERIRNQSSWDHAAGGAHEEAAEDPEAHVVPASGNEPEHPCPGHQGKPAHCGEMV